MESGGQGSGEIEQYIVDLWIILSITQKLNLALAVQKEISYSSVDFLTEVSGLC